MWELEPGAVIIEQIALPAPTGFDTPDRLDAFLDTVRWGAASTTDVRSIQTPTALASTWSLLIADDIVLGKTIEAGMTILELILRHRARV